MTQITQPSQKSLSAECANGGPRSRPPVQDEIPVERALPWYVLLCQSSAFRKTILLIAMAGIWQAYAAYLNRPLLLPTFLATIEALCDGLIHGPLLARAFVSIRVLLIGYSLGLVAALLLTALALTSRIGSEFLETCAAMFNPLPAIALLPLALLWFGLGTPSILFVLVHAVLWPIALNVSAGFASVSPTLRMVGRSYGLSHLSFISRILIPAALPSVLTGLKIGWAFAWRTLIAAELVFGVASGSGGLGWFIYENKSSLDIDKVFAGLLSVILIGILVENVVFKYIEDHTVRRWGMRQ